MQKELTLPAIRYQREFSNTARLQRLLLRLSLVNLLIVSLLGVLLRSFPFLHFFPVNYKNLLHGHSHFAFGGWVMPAMLCLMLRCFPDLEKLIDYKHSRNIAVLFLVSAYGMLVAFPLQGYKAISISFSTLSIAGSFYLAIVIWKNSKALRQTASLLFLRAGLFYLVLSSLGPLATGPLIATGNASTPLYFDAIYFYLHFQYNGWFTFAVLAFFYRYAEQQKLRTLADKVFWLMNISCIPAFVLSVLWHQPGIAFNVLGGIAALLQIVAAGYFLKDFFRLKVGNKYFKQILGFAFAAFGLKIVLQFFSAWPSIALLAYHQRNFVIAYLHLALLGFISLFLVLWIVRSFNISMRKPLKLGFSFFILAFVATEVLLIAEPIAVINRSAIPHYAFLLFSFSLLLPLGITLLMLPCFHTGAQKKISNTIFIKQFSTS